VRSEVHADGRMSAAKSTALRHLSAADGRAAERLLFAQPWRIRGRRLTLACELVAQAAGELRTENAMHHAKSSSRSIVLLLLVVLAASTIGCRTGGGHRRDDDDEVRTTIDVQNQSFNDMTVYMLVNGARTRLGIAPGNKTTVLTIPAYLLTGVSFVRFVADPLGGHRTPVTEEVDVTPGDQLVMVINPGG
jgi:hypothetical protein